MAVITITANKPFGQAVRAEDVSNIWTDVSELEVRAQLRTSEDRTGLLISNLHDFMTWEFDGDDLLITWVMTGQDTRELYDKQWGINKTGYVNFVISDVGVEDVHALVAPVIQIIGKDITTTPAGDA